MRLFNTATGEVEELQLRDDGVFSMYVCGPTVYDEAHVGHGRTALVYDVLRRYLEARGLVVRHVSNVTDIDDKIIAKAFAEGRDPSLLARQYEQRWWEVMAALGVKRPNETPHATAFVGDMLELIEDLLDRGVAYETDDGVYLSVEAIPDYGLLAHRNLADLLASSEARVEAREDKRSAADFALWKKAKPNEPKWPSRFGEGRPGWHTECVTMALQLLGDGFDLHGGGVDLVFPHHENERAQAVGLGRSFARHWMHGGMVEVAGEKMSKSLGNFTTLQDLLDSYDPRAYRLLVLRAHYRSPLEVTPDTLLDAASALERIDNCARRFVGAAAGDSDEAEALSERFYAYMDEDLDTPRATAVLFEAIRHAHLHADAGKTAVAAALAHRALLHFGQLGIEAATGEDLDTEAVALVRERDEARAARDFARADRLRRELEERGFVVEDTPTGTTARRRSSPS